MNILQIFFIATAQGHVFAVDNSDLVQIISLHFRHIAEIFLAGIRGIRMSVDMRKSYPKI